MNVKISLLVLCISFFFLACQKEINFSQSGGSGGTGSATGTLLVKTTSRQGTDSTVVIYTYNAARKLINDKAAGMQAGYDVTNEFRYYRNSAGIITNYTQINPNLAASGIDSVVTRVNYGGSPARYTSIVATLQSSLFTVLDSTVFMYDASGKLTGRQQYQSVPLLAQPYQLALKDIFTYAANGNVIQMDSYTHNTTTGTDDLTETLKYTYDNKTASVTTDNEAFLLNHSEWVSVNNVIKYEIIFPGTPSNNQTYTSAYIYNSNNQPASGAVTVTPGGGVINGNFFYQ